MNDFPNRVADSLADAGVNSEIGILADELFHAFRQRADFCCSPLIGLDLVGAFFVCRQQLRQNGQLVSNFCVAHINRISWMLISMVSERLTESLVFLRR